MKINIGDTVRIKGTQKIYAVRRVGAFGNVELTRNGHYYATMQAGNLVIRTPKAQITPAMIAAEKKPTRKAALMEIKYGHLGDDNGRAWDIIHDRVPYYAVEFFFDRVERMSQFYTA